MLSNSPLTTAGKLLAMTDSRRTKKYICKNGTEFIISTKIDSCGSSDSKEGQEALAPGLVKIIHLLAETAAEEDLKKLKLDNKNLNNQD